MSGVIHDVFSSVFCAIIFVIVFLEVDNLPASDYCLVDNGGEFKATVKSKILFSTIGAHNSANLLFFRINNRFPESWI
jgi:hypothetical protein